MHSFPGRATQRQSARSCSSAIPLRCQACHWLWPVCSTVASIQGRKEFPVHPFNRKTASVMLEPHLRDLVEHVFQKPTLCLTKLAELKCCSAWYSFSQKVLCEVLKLPFKIERRDRSEPGPQRARLTTKSCELNEVLPEHGLLVEAARVLLFPLHCKLLLASP